MDRKENYISVTGAHYVPDIVLGFLPRIVDAYKMRDHKSKNFQVSTYENTFSTAGVLLTVVSLESFGNRIRMLEEETGTPLKKLPEIFSRKNGEFPVNFNALLQEIYILRDVIAHNHIYAISSTVDEESWDIKDFDAQLVLGRGPLDPKYKERVDLSKKSKLLKLNVQPLQIGFEDLFTVLVVFDLFVHLAQSMFSDSHVPFRLYHKIEKSVESSLSRLLTYYYRQISNDEYLGSLEGILKELRASYSTFLISPYDDAFVKNVCPRKNCGATGFHTIHRVNNCRACGLSTGVKSAP